VVFEQGHTLPIPEPVPFRLTHDLINGMGVAGVEGVFPKCCEETLKGFFFCLCLCLLVAALIRTILVDHYRFYTREVERS